MQLADAEEEIGRLSRVVDDLIYATWWLEKYFFDLKDPVEEYPDVIKLIEEDEATDQYSQEEEKWLRGARDAAKTFHERRKAEHLEKVLKSDFLYDTSALQRDVYPHRRLPPKPSSPETNRGVVVVEAVYFLSHQRTCLRERFPGQLAIRCDKNKFLIDALNYDIYDIFSEPSSAELAEISDLTKGREFGPAGTVMLKHRVRWKRCLARRIESDVESLEGIRLVGTEDEKAILMLEYAKGTIHKLSSRTILKNQCRGNECFEDWQHTMLPVNQAPRHYIFGELHALVDVVHEMTKHSFNVKQLLLASRKIYVVHRQNALFGDNVFDLKQFEPGEKFRERREHIVLSLMSRHASSSSQIQPGIQEEGGWNKNHHVRRRGPNPFYEDVSELPDECEPLPAVYHYHMTTRFQECASLQEFIDDSAAGYYKVNDEVPPCLDLPPTTENLSLSDMASIEARSYQAYKQVEKFLNDELDKKSMELREANEILGELESREQRKPDQPTTDRPQDPPVGPPSPPLHTAEEGSKEGVPDLLEEDERGGHQSESSSSSSIAARRKKRPPARNTRRKQKSK